MTTMQLNAEIYRGLSVIAEDEGLMKRAARYISKLARQKQEADETLMTKEEFFEKIDRSLEQARRGEGIGFTDKSAMNTWLNKL